MPESWKWYVYIVECLDGTYYTGLTWDVFDREFQHRVGKGSEYTKQHGFKELVYYEEHNDLDTARLREKQIKDWSQTKKKKLISGEWKQEWSRLARRIKTQNSSRLQDRKRMQK